VELEVVLRDNLRRLQQHDASVRQREEAVRLKEAELAVRGADLDARARSQQDHEVRSERDIAARLGAAHEASDTAKRELARLSDLESSLQQRRLGLTSREGELAALAKELETTERKLAAKLEAVATEKELCRKLSDDLLRREGSVRAAEKGINGARAQLKALEDDVGARVKKVLEDQSALKRWAEELDRRDRELADAQRRFKAAVAAGDASGL
jgi:chromosome segregation ATPase